MEIAQYLRLVRKWFWLVIVLAILGGAAGYYQRNRQPLIYQTSVTVSVGGALLNTQSPNASAVLSEIQLVHTYAALVETNSVLQATVETLDLPLSANALRGVISVRIVERTPLMVITARHNDPELAAQIANGVAEQLVVQGPTNLTDEQQNQINMANTQIQALSIQLEASRSQLARLDEQLAAAEDGEDIVSLNMQRNQVIDQINQASETIARFSQTIADLQQQSNWLTVVEPAAVPGAPLSRSVMSGGVAGVIAGVVLAFGIMLLVDYLDDRLRTSEQVAQSLSLPVLGAIADFGDRANKDQRRLITAEETLTPVVETYRALRTNLLFGADNTRKGAYIITSPNPVEGKSTTSANLAVVMAQAGLRVVLIDADLRRPVLHEIFGIENDAGLTTLLFADPDTLNVAPDPQTQLPNTSANGGSNGGHGGKNSDVPHADLQSCFHDVGIPNLYVVPSGFVPPNPTEILGSLRMQRWVQMLRAADTVDVVLLDTPPCLVVSDSSVLAASTGLDVVLVVDSRRTRRAAAARSRDQFQQVGVRVKGIVLNKVNPREESYKYGYGYGYYYSSSDGSRVKRNGKHTPNATTPQSQQSE